MFIIYNEIIIFIIYNLLNLNYVLILNYKFIYIIIYFKIYEHYY